MSANFDREYRLAAGKAGGMGFEIGEKSKSQPVPLPVSYTHLTLPTNSLV